MAMFDLRPVTLADAGRFVTQYHRHHRRLKRALFALGAFAGPRLVGVAVIARPVARFLDDGVTAEVARVATDGTKNACSFLYGAAWRAARAHGYRRMVTYTLPEEGGASLRGAGWRLIGEAGGGSWDRPSRRRTTRAPTQRKLRWEAPVC